MNTEHIEINLTLLLPIDCFQSEPIPYVLLKPIKILTTRIESTRLNKCLRMKIIRLFIISGLLVLYLIPQQAHTGLRNSTNNKSELKSRGLIFNQEGYQISENYDLSDNNIASLEEQFEKMPVSKREKKLILNRWKKFHSSPELLHGSRTILLIRNYTEKDKKRKEHKHLSLYTNLFKTGSNNMLYSMVLRLYPDGDGLGTEEISKVKGGYFSIFYCLAKSEKDEELEWPFKHRFQFSILDQVKGENHKTDAHTPDLANVDTIDSFEKPKKQLNTPIGFPMAIKNSELLSSYLIDDSIAIEITTTKP